ncbi:MAG TPA: hypothetical protein VH684_14120 [Xanthobacteraceae bacterium]|jgi:hypothetical protein
MGRAETSNSSAVAVAQAEVQRAGSAWGCRYSSSAEFEAAVLRARLRAGVYRAVRCRYVLYASALTGMLAVASHLVNYILR